MSMEQAEDVAVVQPILAQAVEAPAEDLHEPGDEAQAVSSPRHAGDAHEPSAGGGGGDDGTLTLIHSVVDARTLERAQVRVDLNAAKQAARTALAGILCPAVAPPPLTPLALAPPGPTLPRHRNPAVKPGSAHSMAGGQSSSAGTSASKSVANGQRPLSASALMGSGVSNVAPGTALSAADLDTHRVGSSRATGPSLPAKPHSAHSTIGSQLAPGIQARGPHGAQSRPASAHTWQGQPAPVPGPVPNVMQPVWTNLVPNMGVGGQQLHHTAVQPHAGSTALARFMQQQPPQHQLAGLDSRSVITLPHLHQVQLKPTPHMRLHNMLSQSQQQTTPIRASEEWEAAPVSLAGLLQPHDDQHVPSMSDLVLQQAGQMDGSSGPTVPHALQQQVDLLAASVPGITLQQAAGLRRSAPPSSGSTAGGSAGGAARPAGSGLVQVQAGLQQSPHGLDGHTGTMFSFAPSQPSTGVSSGAQMVGRRISSSQLQAAPPGQAGMEAEPHVMLATRYSGPGATPQEQLLAALSSAGGSSHFDQYAHARASIEELLGVHGFQTAPAATTMSVASPLQASRWGSGPVDQLPPSATSMSPVARQQSTRSSTDAEGLDSPGTGRLTLPHADSSIGTPNASRHSFAALLPGPGSSGSAMGGVGDSGAVDEALGLSGFKAACLQAVAQPTGGEPGTVRELRQLHAELVLLQQSAELLLAAQGGASSEAIAHGLRTVHDRVVAHKSVHPRLTRPGQNGFALIAASLMQVVSSNAPSELRSAVSMLTPLLLPLGSSSGAARAETAADGEQQVPSPFSSSPAWAHTAHTLPSPLSAHDLSALAETSKAMTGHLGSLLSADSAGSASPVPAHSPQQQHQKAMAAQMQAAAAGAGGFITQLDALPPGLLDTHPPRQQQGVGQGMGNRRGSEDYAGLTAPLRSAPLSLANQVAGLQWTQQALLAQAQNAQASPGMPRSSVPLTLASMSGGGAGAGAVHLQHGMPMASCGGAQVVHLPMGVHAMQAVQMPAAAGGGVTWVPVNTAGSAPDQGMLVQSGGMVGGGGNPSGGGVQLMAQAHVQGHGAVHVPVTLHSAGVQRGGATWAQGPNPPAPPHLRVASTGLLPDQVSHGAQLLPPRARSSIENAPQLTPGLSGGWRAVTTGGNNSGGLPALAGQGLPHAFSHGMSGAGDGAAALLGAGNWADQLGQLAAQGAGGEAEAAWQHALGLSPAHATKLSQRLPVSSGMGGPSDHLLRALSWLQGTGPRPPPAAGSGSGAGISPVGSTPAPLPAGFSEGLELRAGVLSGSSSARQALLDVGGAWSGVALSQGGGPLRSVSKPGARSVPRAGEAAPAVELGGDPSAWRPMHSTFLDGLQQGLLHRAPSELLVDVPEHDAPVWADGTGARASGASQQ